MSTRKLFTREEIVAKYVRSYQQHGPLYGSYNGQFFKERHAAIRSNDVFLKKLGVELATEPVLCSVDEGEVKDYLAAQTAQAAAEAKARQEAEAEAAATAEATTAAPPTAAPKKKPTTRKRARKTTTPKATD